MPLPTMAAISLGDSTTESGPAGVLRRSTLLWLEDSALGVGAHGRVRHGRELRGVRSEPARGRVQERLPEPPRHERRHHDDGEAAEPQDALKTAVHCA